MNRREFIAGLGSAVAWPLVARVQQGRVPVIGYLSGFVESADLMAPAFREGLRQQGYVEGRNVEILYRWAATHYGRLPELAADLLHRQVTVIFATGNPSAALAAKSATAMVPIVFAFGGDPIEVGLVTNLNRPGGNVTGITFLTRTLTQKRLELLQECVPAAETIGFLDNPTLPSFEVRERELQTAAQVLGVHLVTLQAINPAEIERAFKIIGGQGIGALVVVADALFATQSRQVTALAARYAVPTIYSTREEAEAGGLMSYGASISNAYRIAGTYVGRILKGDKPADLLVQQSTKVELVLNLKTAKALGLSIPLSLLVRADEVIE